MGRSSDLAPWASGVYPSRGTRKVKFSILQHSSFLTVNVVAFYSANKYIWGWILEIFTGDWSACGSCQ